MCLLQLGYPEWCAGFNNMLGPCIPARGDPKLAQGANLGFVGRNEEKPPRGGPKQPWCVNDQVSSIVRIFSCISDTLKR